MCVCVYTTKTRSYELYTNLSLPTQEEESHQDALAALVAAENRKLLKKELAPAPVPLVDVAEVQAQDELALLQVSAHTCVCVCMQCVFHCYPCLLIIYLTWLRFGCRMS